MSDPLTAAEARRRVMNLLSPITDIRELIELLDAYKKNGLNPLDEICFVVDNPIIKKYYTCRIYGVLVIYSGDWSDFYLSARTPVFVSSELVFNIIKDCKCREKEESDANGD